MIAELPIRNAVRLPDYDYSAPGEYFVTVCCQNRAKIFGEVIDGEITLNEYGDIAKKCWLDLPNHYSNIELDVYMIMPDHFHAIISILPLFDDRSGLRPDPTNIIAAESTVGEGLRPSRRGMEDKRHGLSEFIRAFKSFSARRINEQRNTPGIKLWQRSFYDHIIRTDADLATLRDYILHNPLGLDTVEDY